MKLMKKILVSAIAISAIAAFNAVAFAEDEATATPEPVVPAATYDATAKTITLSGFEVANDQKTLLILNADVDQFDDTTAKAEAEGGAIVQIDQSTTINGVAIPVGEKEAGDKLWIRVGGDDTGFIELEYTIPGGEEPELILVGDVNGSKAVDGIDASALAMYVAKVGEIEDKYYNAADVNDSSVVDGIDASALAMYVAKVGEIEDKYYNAADVNDSSVVDGIDASALAMYVAKVGDLCCEYTKDKTTTAVPPTATVE